jgi:hypothetical protein
VTTLKPKKSNKFSNLINLFGKNKPFNQASSATHPDNKN